MKNLELVTQVKHLVFKMFMLHIKLFGNS